MGLKDDPLFAAQPKWDEGGPPEQYQILTVHTPKGMTRVILFSKDILKAEWKTDMPRHDVPADKRARAWAKREARMKRAVEQHRSRDRQG